MAEYIERESLLKQMEGYCSANCGHEHSEDPLCPSCFMNDAIILVEDWTAADMRPVVRGEWIHHKGGYSDHYECTVCKKAIVLTERWNFCPNCGADVREG